MERARREVELKSGVELKNEVQLKANLGSGQDLPAYDGMAWHVAWKGEMEGERGTLFRAMPCRAVEGAKQHSQENLGRNMMLSRRWKRGEQDEEEEEEEETV